MFAHQPLILVADDDASCRSLLSDLLTDEGYRIDARSQVLPTEVAALAPDLLILDHGIGPGERRLNLLAALRSDPATARLPILLVTGAAQQVEREQERLDALGIGVLLKPFDIDVVVERVRDCLEHPEDCALSA